MRTMQPAAAPGHRIWPHACVAAAVLWLTPTLSAATTWQLGWGRDPDMSGVHELIAFFLIMSAVPALSLSFGVMAPCAIAVDRIMAGRASRLLNIVLLGVVIGLVGFAAFLLGGALLSWESGQSIREVLSRMFRPRRPDIAVMVAAFFGLVGMIIAAGMRCRARGSS